MLDNAQENWSYFVNTISHDVISGINDCSLHFVITFDIKSVRSFYLMNVIVKSNNGLMKIIGRYDIPHKCRPGSSNNSNHCSLFEFFSDSLRLKIVRELKDIDFKHLYCIQIKYNDQVIGDLV